MSGHHTLTHGAASAVTAERATAARETRIAPCRVSRGPALERTAAPGPRSGSEGSHGPEEHREPSRGLLGRWRRRNR
ncbi:MULTISPECIES: hypothetical protein [Streptomyces]|uniref:Uncharacterized protein n=1 Tax=Streptomyces fimbriatus TaxID=68197 RepID=A0ABW0DEZ7_STRFI